jgi:O-antigen/teichoic acid export membrane protein
MGRRLFSDVARYAPGLGMSIVLGTASTVIFTRLASPEEMGSYLLTSALATSASTPLGFGVSQAVLRLLPAYVNKGQQGKLLHALFWLGLLLGATATLIVCALLWLGFGGRYFQLGYILPASALTFFGVTSAAQIAVLQATFASGHWSAYTALSAAIRLLLSLALFPLVGAVPALLWGSASTTLGLWLGREWQQRRELPFDSLAGMPETIRIWSEASGFGMPLAISSVGDQILTYSDRYLIGAVLGPAAVGLYSTNYSIAEKLLVLVQAPLIYAASPQLFSHWEGGSPLEAERLIRTATRWLLMLGIPILVFTAVASRLLSSILLGDTFAEGHFVIPIVTGSILLWAASQYGHASFQLAKTSWILAIALLCAAAANVLSVFALTQVIGYLGGAVGTGIGYLVYACFIWIVTRMRGPLPWRIPWATAARVTAAAAAGGAVWRLVLPEHVTNVVDVAMLAVGGSLGLLLYAGILALVGELPWSPASGWLRGMATTLLRRKRGAVKEIEREPTR